VWRDGHDFRAFEAEAALDHAGVGPGFPAVEHALDSVLVVLDLQMHVVGAHAPQDQSRHLAEEVAAASVMHGVVGGPAGIDIEVEE